MLSIRNYVRPQTIEEAYEYAKKPLSVVLGGMLWLKMQNRNVNFAIDLSDLHLDQIEEIDDEIDLEDLYPTWNIYLGEEEFILDRNIFERIFNL